MTPSPFRLALVNQSTRLTDSDLAVIAAVIQGQLNEDLLPDLLADLGLPPADVPALVFCVGAIPRGDAPPADAGRTITFVDDIKVPGALGYHDEEGGRPGGYIGVGTILDAGGTVFDGALSILVCASHEALEQAADLRANLWAWGPVITLPSGASGFLYAREVSDPVESLTYTRRTPEGREVTVSDFVTQRWFDPQATEGPYSHTGAAPGPFQMAPGGYLLVMGEGGQVERVFADVAPSAAQGARCAARVRADQRIRSGR